MLVDAPWAFGASPDDDVAVYVAGLAEHLAEDRNAIFAIEEEGVPGVASPDREGSGGQPRLVAAAGISRMKRRKFAHRARIWGVFVEPEYRGRGLGRAVVGAALDLARSWAGVDYVDLAVSENAPEALRLYESLGFEAWGREPAAVEHEGRRYDEIHMTLRLRS